jgi:hypothetical protein
LSIAYCKCFIEKFKVLDGDKKIKLYCKAQSNLMIKVRNTNSQLPAAKKTPTNVMHKYQLVS